MTTTFSSEAGSGSTRGDIFATTHWTVVLAAGRRHTPQSDLALEELCRTYWFPLYAYVRRRVRSKHDAEDLTQAFFARLLERNDFAELDREQGRFRAFLLASLKHFLVNEWKRGARQKRGGGTPPLSMDWATADSQFQMAASHEPSPDVAFDREWAMALLARVVARLQEEFEREGRAELFEKLKVFLTLGKGALSHRQAAEALGMEEGAVRVAVHRLRKRYRHLLRDEIANTLADPVMVHEEMKSLFGAFAG